MGPPFLISVYNIQCINHSHSKDSVYGSLILVWWGSYKDYCFIRGKLPRICMICRRKVECEKAEGGVNIVIFDTSGFFEKEICLVPTSHIHCYYVRYYCVINCLFTTGHSSCSGGLVFAVLAVFSVPQLIFNLTVTGEAQLLLRWRPRAMRHMPAALAPAARINWCNNFSFRFPLGFLCDIH